MFVTDAWAIKTASSEDVHSLETAMAQWTAALREQNTESFLRFFSRTRPWRYVGTATRRPKATAVTYQRLEHDLRSKEGWYEVLFDADGEDCFRDHVIADGGKLWQRRGLTFVPPGSEYPSPVYVLWRKEKGHWVIEAIAEPSS